MLLLDIEAGDENFVQGFVRTTWPAGDRIAAGAASAWARLFVRSAALWSQPRPASAAIRLSASPGQPLTSVHSFVAPKAQAERLRLVLAAFLRGSEMSGAEADVPQDQADLPGVFVHPDEARVGVRYETLRTSLGDAIHFNYRLADQLARIIQIVSDMGMSVAYEAQIAPWSPPRDLLRSVLYDVARLEETRATPREVAQDQRALAERLKRAAQQRPAYHIEECLATSPAALDALTDSVNAVLEETVYGTLGAPPQLVALPQAQAEAFAYHVHSRVMVGAPEAEIIAAAAVKEEADRLLACRALISVAASGGAEPPGGDPLFATLTGAPKRPGGAGAPAAGQSADAPFLFVSYARKDADAVYPLVDDLATRGVALWVDRHIRGGEDWTMELEARLIQCAGVLALISPSFVSSKYCPREVHFADALNRPIMPVALAPSLELGRGLRFLLNTIQIIDFQQARALDAILDAIGRHAPQAWRSTA